MFPLYISMTCPGTHTQTKRLITAHCLLQDDASADLSLVLASDQDWDTHVITHISLGHRHPMLSVSPSAYDRWKCWRCADQEPELTQTHISKANELPCRLLWSYGYRPLFVTSHSGYFEWLGYAPFVCVLLFAELINVRNDWSICMRGKLHFPEGKLTYISTVHCI